MDDNVKMMAMIRGIKTGPIKPGWENMRKLRARATSPIHNVLQAVLTRIENKDENGQTPGLEIPSAPSAGDHEPVIA